MNFRITALACAVLFGVALGGVFLSDTKAQESDTLVQKMDELIGSLNSLFAEIAPQTTETGTDESANDVVSLQSSTSRGVDYGYCIDGWETWPQSNKKKENAPWSLEQITTMVYSGDQPLNQFIDLNGDGLTDHVYSRSHQNVYAASTPSGYRYYRYGESCVMLNNGSGFEIAHRCRVDKKYDQNTRKWDLVFYGDCADLD